MGAEKSQKMRFVYFPCSQKPTVILFKFSIKPQSNLFQSMLVVDPTVIVIPRVGKRHTLSEQAQKDQVLITDRVRRNAPLIDAIRSTLEYACGPSPQKKDLLVVARQLTGPCKIALDRLAKRSRDCLICWFCENWKTIETQFAALCSEQPRAFDSRNSCSSTKVSEDEVVVPTGCEPADDFDLESIFDPCNFDGTFFPFEDNFTI
jgi:hypothetical protein